MIYTIPTDFKEFTLAVKVTTARPYPIRIIMKDTEVANLEFTNRYKTVNGDYTFLIRLPVTGREAKLIIYNEEIGNIPSLSDNTFKVRAFDWLPLEKKLDVIDFDPKIKSFVNFATRFCYNAGALAPNNYISKDRQFLIEYLPVIADNMGRVINTSARISKDTGVIQVSQDKFIPMTFPMRMAILLHEFAHFNLNANIDNEVEADLNALTIYLGLGYPRIEAHEAWLTAFIGMPTVQNEERYNILKKFIDDFDQTYTVINNPYR